MKPTRFFDRTTPPHIGTLILLAGMSALSINIFMPSLPAMAKWFDAPYALMQLSVALYLALSAVLQVLIGPITDRFGRRQVVLGALIIFCFATVGTLVAPTVEVFLFFRMMQAVLAVLMVLSRAIVRDMVPGAQAASMIGYVTLGMSVMPMLGPLLGGFLDETIGWQANFAVLLVVGLLTLFIVWHDLGETAAKGQGSFIAQFRQYPHLLRSQRFWGYTLCAAFASGTFFAYLGGAPFVGTEVFNLTAKEIGVFFATSAVGYGAGNFVSGRYSTRIGINKMVLYGAILTVICPGILALISLAGLQTAYSFFGLTFVLGIGNGMTLPNANAGLLSVRPELAGTASGLGSAIMMGGGAGLAALTGAVLSVETGELPLIWVMLGSAIASLLAILWVLRRAKQIGL